MHVMDAELVESDMIDNVFLVSAEDTICKLTPLQYVSLPHYRLQRKTWQRNLDRRLL